jgi:hypothetical protein
MLKKACLFLAISTVLSAAVPDQEALSLLSKASAAFDANMARETHWNWTVQEKRELATRSGDIVQSLPSVTAESVIRNNGSRCNAVVAWGDGLKPFKAKANSDERCLAMKDFRAPFEVQELLRGSQAKTVADWEGGAAISVLPDKTRQRSSDPSVRCAASIEATVRLDVGSFFPRSIEGKVVGDGCEQRGAPLVQYGRASSVAMRSTFRKGASFRMVFQLQKDKFGNEANSFWICTSQHYLMPWESDTSVVAYWGRQVGVKTGGHQLVKDIETRAREFGADSAVSFDGAGQY